MIQIITVAQGDSYLRHAQALQESMVKHNWPNLTIVDSKMLRKFPYRSTLHPKANFGYFVNSLATKILLIDSDCLAVGPFPALPELSRNEIGGRITGIAQVTPSIKLTFLASTCLLFGHFLTALNLSQDWIERSLCTKQTNDEPALMEAALELDKINLNGTYSKPFPTLIHLGITSNRHNQ